tara:strand:- start:425 stop:589 length:165 start_codon:yes stop_codon:yes gene_type:complete
MAIIILIFIILATICLCAHAYKSSLEMQENNIIKNMEEYEQKEKAKQQESKILE